MGIHAVRQVILADLAEVITGAMIRATTAGRIPLNMAESVTLFFIKSGVKKIAIASIIRNDGIIVPSAATVDPRLERSLSPTATDMLTAKIPGND